LKVNKFDKRLIILILIFLNCIFLNRYF
jgi:hypothetical protein